VEEYRKMGFEVLVQSSAARALCDPTRNMRNAGDDRRRRKTLFARSDLILKVKQPQVNQETGCTRWR